MLSRLEQADRRNEPRCVDAVRAKPQSQLRRLGFGPDHAHEAGVAAPQGAFHDLEVERMAVRHDEVERAGWRVVHGQRRLVVDDHTRRGVGGKLLAALIDPGEPAGHALEDARDFLAHVAGPEQHHLELAFLGLDRLDPPKRKPGVAAAALAERVAEDEPALTFGFAGGEHLARDLERAVLEVAAADGAAGLVHADPHTGARSARRGAARLNDPDFDVAHGSPSARSPGSPGPRAARARASLTSLRPRRRSRGTRRARASAAARRPPWSGAPRRARSRPFPTARR